MLDPILWLIEEVPSLQLVNVCVLVLTLVQPALADTANHRHINPSKTLVLYFTPVTPHENSLDYIEPAATRTAVPDALPQGYSPSGCSISPRPRRAVLTVAAS